MRVEYLVDSNGAVFNTKDDIYRCEIKRLFFGICYMVRFDIGYDSEQVRYYYPAGIKYVSMEQASANAKKTTL